jgi:hypothetical protein
MISNTEVDILDLAKREAARRLDVAIWNLPGLFQSIYGQSDVLDGVLQAWRVNGIPLHNINVVPQARIPGSDGSYESRTDAIQLADAFVSIASFERLVDAIVEELGHRFDAALGGDTAGDEGQALVAALRGEPVPTTGEDRSAETGMEYTSSVSDSGGYEGSSKTLVLETMAGSKITYYYEHYYIPDRFIIRYQGRNLIDTGFTGGSATGTINVPAGKSDKVEIIVATDDEGTAWLYNVSAEAQECADVPPWIFTADNEFKHNDQTDNCETTGTIYVGNTHGASKLFRGSGTLATYYRSGLLVARGAQLYSEIGNIPERLFTADIDLNLNTGKASLSSITQGNFKLAGLAVEFESMSVLKDTMAFDVRFQMPEGASGLLIKTADFYSQALRITSQGAQPRLGFRINPPGSKDFRLAGFLDVSASKMALEYRGGEDALRFQSKLVFSNTKIAKTTSGIDTLEVDLSGPNYIQVNSDGNVDIVGVLKATGSIRLVSGWSLESLELNIDTTTREVGGAATLLTPFGVRFGEAANARAEVEFVYNPFQLDKVGLTLDNLNKAIPGYPAFFFQRIGGSVDNFAPSNNKPVEAKFSIGASLGPKIRGTSLALSQFDATVTSQFLEGQLSTDMLRAEFSLVTRYLRLNLGTITLAKDVSTARLDWRKGELSFTGTTDILDGFVVSTGNFKANRNFDFSFARSAAISLPNFVPTYGGTKLTNSNVALSFTNDGNYANDYAAGWGEFNVVTPWDQYTIPLGLRINFDGSIIPIGSGNIPITSSWFLTGGRDYAMLTATWEHETPGVQVRVIKPDGTVIEEKDFASNRIAIVDAFSSGKSRSVIIDSPEQGTWDLEITDVTGLGAVYYEATGAVQSPSFNFIGSPRLLADGSVSFDFAASSQTPLTYVNFYYDDDLTELNGLLAGSMELNPAVSSGTFTWNAAQVVPGSYYIYAMLDDLAGPIVIVKNQDAVTVGSEADLSVNLQAATDQVTAGETVQMTLSVANLSSNTVAKGAKAYINLPAGVTLNASTLPIQPSTFSQYEIDLGDIAASSELTSNISVTVNQSAQPADQLSADIYVIANTYDPITLNDSDVLQFIVPADPVPSTVNLSIDSKIDLVSAPTVNTPFSYTVTVTNTGSSNATGVVLKETVLAFTSMTSNLASTFYGNELTVPIGTVGAGQSVDVTINALAQVAGLTSSTSVVTADGVDGEIIDNQQIGILEVLAATPGIVDLSLALVSDVDNTVRVSVRNDGPGIASDVRVKIKFPAGAQVISTLAEQGSFDSDSGVWTVGNLRDKLTRTLTLSLIGLKGGEITAEIIAVNELDSDSFANDGQGDDYASLSGVYTIQSGDIVGTDGEDTIYADRSADTINTLAGDDMVFPGAGSDTITLGPGADQIIGTLAELDGDVITDLEKNDTLVFRNVTLPSPNENILFWGPSSTLQISMGDPAATKAIKLGGPVVEDLKTIDQLGVAGAGIYVWYRGGDSCLAVQDIMPTLEEQNQINQADINGITNSDILTGNGINRYRIQMDPRAATAAANSLGVYEIDAFGLIHDVRILLPDARQPSTSDLVTGVKANHTLGFFIIEDGKRFADTLLSSDVLTFQNRDIAPGNAFAGQKLSLAVNGSVQNLHVYHSHAAALNPDGVQHVISGLSRDGNKRKITLGFEDNYGGGDQDYQDVLFSIETLV